MKKLTIMMTIFMLFLTGSLLYIGLSIQNSNKPYKALENDLKEIAQSYISTEKVGVNVGSSIELSTKKMIEDNIIDEVKVEDDTCDGYVEIIHNMDGYSYKTYIKCDKYETYKDK
jgi:hypothetical protein